MTSWKNPQLQGYRDSSQTSEESGSTQAFLVLAFSTSPTFFPTFIISLLDNSLLASLSASKLTHQSIFYLAAILVVCWVMLFTSLPSSVASDCINIKSQLLRLWLWETSYHLAQIPLKKDPLLWLPGMLLMDTFSCQSLLQPGAALLQIPLFPGWLTSNHRSMQWVKTWPSWSEGLF